MSSFSTGQYQIPSAPLLFLTAPDSKLTRYLEEICRLLVFKPEILDAVEEDLTHHCLEKKRTRLIDEHWTSPGQELLPNIVEQGPQENRGEHLTLNAGRPRMSARASYFFWMLSIYGGGVKTQKTRTLLADSISVGLLLLAEGIKAPGLSTIVENTNAIRPRTREMVLDAQIDMARKEGLDSFEKIQFDSTQIDANTAWPLDSALIWKLCRRLSQRIQKLKYFGLSSLKMPVVDEIRKDLKRLDFKINCCSANQAKKRKELYQEFLEDAEDASQLFSAKRLELLPQIVVADLKPSKMERLKTQLHAIEEDIDKLYQKIEHCIARVLEGESQSSKEKLLSIADPDAAYLKKGSRRPRIGYCPQLARSEKGLVTAIIVPKGNPGDAPLLQPLCEQAFKRTGVVAKDSSGDGGYASKDNRKWLLKMGVERPSFSSSKGKTITPIKDWESQEFLNLRKWRSAVEALMSQLKDQVGFGAVVKRGWKKVSAELTDKVLAFNFMRLSILRS